MQKKWIIKEDDAAAVAELARALDVTELMAKILIHRGITNLKDAEIFLNPEIAQESYDPFLMLGMRAAIDRIIFALEHGEKICIYGDYDVDGISATTILTRTLQRVGGDVMNYIPMREEGYGLNIPALEKIISAGVKLLISVDCGISNEKEISAVKNKIDVIVTDHHLPALEKVLSAVAVVNPNQEGCPYPNKNLCGAGVAFKISQALMHEMKIADFKSYTLDIELAALATVADLVPLTGENRKIVRLGLKEMRDSKCIGLRALVNVAGLSGKKISAGHVAFQIAPRLNSIGRLKAASEGLKLLLTEDEDEAIKISERLNAANDMRKKIEAAILAEAEEKLQDIRADCGGDLYSIIISGENWNAGVIGLTASKLVEKYNLPTIIISELGEIARGSCRSIPALHMKNALDSMAEIFSQYGGHAQAAGFTLETKKIPELRRKFDEYIKNNLTDEDFLPVLKVDALIHPSELTVRQSSELENLEPFGIGNPSSVLACRNVRGNSVKIIGNDRRHLSFFVEKVRAVGFGLAKFAPLVESEPIAMVYQIGLDDWQETLNVECRVSQIEPIGGAEDFPTREQLIDVYRFLRVFGGRSLNICDLAKKFNAATGKNFSMYRFFCAIDIFSELGLFRQKESGFEMPPSKKKLDLNNSRTFRLGKKNG